MLCFSYPLSSLRRGLLLALGGAPKRGMFGHFPYYIDVVPPSGTRIAEHSENDHEGPFPRDLLQLEQKISRKESKKNVVRPESKTHCSPGDVQYTEKGLCRIQRTARAASLAQVAGLRDK